MPEPLSADADAVGPRERHLSEPLAGRKVIVAFEMLAGMTRTIEQLRRWGAKRPLLLAEGLGLGPLPTEEDADIVMLDDPHYESMTEQVRSRLRPEARLTDEARRAVDAYDPEGSAWWWASPIAPNTPLLGRDVLGGRPPHQIALEDKALVDELLAAVDAPHSPAVLAPATYDDLIRATADVLRVTGGDQVVWSGDASHGISGGGDYVRWVRSPEQAGEFAEFFSGRCDRVRVSAFLEGVPCSIHGIVLPDGVAVLRPVELVSLRDLERGTFVYAGMGTTWTPPPPHAERIRALARAVGLHLQRVERYVGAFCLDGVLTAEGFRVTEMNPRFSGGLTRFGLAAPEAQLELVQMNALLGRDIGLSAADLEEMVCELAEETRFVDAFGVSAALRSAETVEVPVAAGDGRLELADVDDAIIGTVSRGPSPMGSFVRLVTIPGVVGIGDRAAPLCVLLYEFVNRHWDAGLGAPLMPPDVVPTSG